MKIAYLDAFSGISGDMVLGALLDAGLPLSHLRAELEGKLGISGYQLSAKKVKRSSITATAFEVKETKKQKSRSYIQIKRMIEKSGLDEKAKLLSLKIFKRIAEAEAKIHGTAVDDVHFHEIGALDSIIDVVGAAIGFCKLGIESFYSSAVPVGSGFIKKTSHGVMPIPAPATVEILKGVPVYGGNSEFELTTPTGAAIAAALCVRFGSIPHMKPSKTGYGAGRTKRKDGVPNLLRIIIGEAHDAAVIAKNLTVIEANIDDITPEAVNHAIIKLLSSGALDVWVTPIVMKKGRQAFCFSVICEDHKTARLRSMVFEETTTLGVREYKVNRTELARKVFKIKTSYGLVRLKSAVTPSGEIRLKPEFDDVSRLAKKTGAAFKKVYDAACLAGMKIPY
ncbi:MAG: TIGR00299 family protein [bacterium]|nr:MAG: TIGR00299 family protein [bacterium]